MIDFLKYRYVCLVVSVAFMIAGVAAYFAKGGFHYHIDFVGGTELTVAFEKPLSVSTFRDRLSGSGWKDLTIQSVGFAQQEGGYREFIVRVGQNTDDLDVAFAKMLKESIKDNAAEIRGISRVGAEVGKDIQWNAVVAVLLSLLIILLYTALRSKYRFAVGAVVALAHDMLAVLVIFLLLGEQISVHVLAAVLAILGYSLNDTLVVYARIRENMKKMQGRSEYDVVNASINQTLRRTLLTSFSTLLTVVSILVWGGETLYGFSLAMLIGVIFGTYSSIYIASPVMLSIGSSK